MAEALPSSGHIDPKSFPFTLVDFYRQGATGSLKVEGENHQKALYFRSGRVLFGSSNDPKDQLGAILIESGRITEQQLEDVNQKVGPGNPLAKALSDSGVVTQRELSEAARAKVERILSDVLSYSEGKFEFEDGVLPKGAVDLKLSAERLFMAAVRRVGDRTFVLRHIEGLDVMLSTKPELQEKLPEIESELAGLSEHFDGLTNLKEAAGRAALDEFEAAKIACGLLFLGLAEKSAAVVASSEETPLFMPPNEGGAELDLGQSSDAPIVVDEPALSFGGPAQQTETPVVVDEPPPSAARDSEATLVMGELPSFTLPTMSSPPAPEPVAAPRPQPVTTSGPPPLKIIAPPKPAERTRPPSKPSKDDLAALDELLGKRSPEGPLAPIHKPAEEWKPSFLPERAPTRGRKQQQGADRRKLLMGALAGIVVLAGLAGGWMVWTNRASGATQRTAANPVRPSAAPSSVPSVAPSAAVSPSNAAASPSATAVVSPAPSAAAASVKPSAAPSATATSVPTAAPATVPSPIKSATAAAPTPKPVQAAGGGLDEARALLRNGDYTAAARGFSGALKDSKATHSVQVLIACSSETVQKALKSAQGQELFIVPIRLQGKACYRLGWGVYESEAKANAAIGTVPGYFKDGNKPKALPLSEMLR